jgi:hypothetical protein
LGDLDADGKIVLKWNLKESGCEDMAWILLAKRTQWWAAVKCVINVMFHKLELFTMAGTKTCVLPTSLACG